MRVDKRQRQIFKHACLALLLACALGSIEFASGSSQMFSRKHVMVDDVAGGSDVAARDDMRSTGKPIRWRVLGTPGPKRVRIGVTVGWCPEASRPRPKIQRVRQVGRPNAVILTAFLIHPAPKSPPGQPSCPGVELPLEYLVTFHNDRNGRPLYDGSVSPPQKRWPRPMRR